MNPALANILQLVEKPYRYVGGEVGVCKKPREDVNASLCLVFPDTYEIGMSNIGLSILYNIVNQRQDMLAERAFTPWPDMESALLDKKESLFSLESKRELKKFDVVGISLPYELSYTNILTIFDTSGIPRRTVNRGDEYPLIIAGGPCAFNPEPIADFFDAIVMGDGERAIIEILEEIKKNKQSRRSKQELLLCLSNTEGVYIPSLHDNKKVAKAFVFDLEAASYPDEPVVAYAAVHDRVGIEVSRGCTRGCRFCQAGFIYRPSRHRSYELATGYAMEQLTKTGHEDLSFLSLSLGDYPCLTKLLEHVNKTWAGSQINIQFPSLRVESLTNDVLSFLGNARSGSFTLAPEAATEKMRARINKGNTDEDLYGSVEKIFAAGWHQIKLYFMIGLPEEKQEELDAIVEMANRCLDIGKKYHRRAEVTVSTSTFIPKPHTPLQWASQISIEETISKQNFLKKNLRRKGLYYKWHNPQMSFLEGVFSRGDRKLSHVIEIAYGLGARFDAWDDKFDFSKWQQAFEQSGIDPREYLIERGKDTIFSWDNLYTELKRTFLWKEYERFLSGESTPDCFTDKCTGCGVCVGARHDKQDTRQINERGIGAVGLGGISEAGASMNIITRPLRAKARLAPVRAGRRCTPNPSAPKATYRIQLTKAGPAAFLGHLEFANAIRRGLRRAGFRLKYSEGFHPHVKMSFGKALPVGIESECEFCDVELLEEISPSEMIKQLESIFPDGVKVVKAFLLSKTEPSIECSIAATHYEIFMSDVLTNDLNNVISRFHLAQSIPYLRMRGDKSANIDLKEYITTLVVNGEGVIGMAIKEKEPMIRITEAISAIFGFTGDEVKRIRIRKIQVEIR